MKNLLFHRHNAVTCMVYYMRVESEEVYRFGGLKDKSFKRIKLLTLIPLKIQTEKAISKEVVFSVAFFSDNPSAGAKIC